MIRLFIRRTLQNYSKFSKRSLKEQNLAVLASANFAKRLIQTSLKKIRETSKWKMREKIILGVVLILFLVVNVSAITASLGNSRMILRIGVGESVERSVLVRNVNDVSVNINITVSGALADNVVLKENLFRLEPEEEKKVYFTIKADEAGRTETKINVGFKPDEGSGVGLSSTVIVIASEEYAGTGTSEEKNGVSPVTGNAISSGNRKFSPLVMLSVSTLILIAAVIVLFVYYKKVKTKKRRGETR